LSYPIDSPRSRLEQLFLDRALNPLQAHLTKQQVEAWAAEAGHCWRRCVLSPFPTLLACIYKHLSPQVSCRDVEDWVCSKLPTLSGENAGDDFCLARRRLPQVVFEQALKHTGELATSEPQHPVWLVDGTGLTLPRTPDHFQVFGKMSRKARMPGARLLLCTDASTGAVMRADLAGCDQGEIRQFLRMLDSVPAGTTVVGDRQFGSYLAFHEAGQRGIGLVTRLNVSRKPVRVEAIGQRDEVQLWRRAPVSLSAFPDQARAAPRTLSIRVVRGRIERKGYRPVEIALATNLMDAQLWPPRKIIELYGLRWLAENDIRDLKLRHGLGLLTCKKENTLRKEVWSGLLAYNLIKVMQKQTGRAPRELSHERCRAILTEACSCMSHAPTILLPQCYQRMLNQLARARLRRQERSPQPRAIVRDPNGTYPMLYKTRQAWYQRYLDA
jgi:hypothetical protein